MLMIYYVEGGDVKLIVYEVKGKMSCSLILVKLRNKGIMWEGFWKNFMKWNMVCLN